MKATSKKRLLNSSVCLSEKVLLRFCYPQLKLMRFWNSPFIKNCWLNLCSGNEASDIKAFWIWFFEICQKYAHFWRVADFKIPTKEKQTEKFDKIESFRLNPWLKKVKLFFENWLVSKLKKLKTYLALQACQDSDAKSKRNNISMNFFWKFVVE